MKNLKKVLALVVVFSMMLSTVAFAAFPDVAEDADYANAVNTIAALGIVGGDDQGNFNPDNTITRAEFTKMICEAQAIKGDAAKGATIFTDVAADHWASGYINMAVGQGIINGMGDGTFAPESPVTYEQAIKMIVVALGYEPMAADRGGYPTGYMVVAQSTGVTKGVSAPAQTDAAKRSLIAELIYNALDVPMMEQTGFGSEKTYSIMDGTGSTNAKRVTLLTSKFDVAKLGGVVAANDKVGLGDITLAKEALTGINKTNEGEIRLAYDNNYKSTNKLYTLTDITTAKVLPAASVGDTNAADYLGQRVIAFVQEDNGNYTIIAIVPEEGKTTSIEIALDDIDKPATLTSTTDRTNIVTSGKKAIAYYANESDRSSTKLSVSDAPSVIWNSVAKTWTGKTAGVDCPLYDIVNSVNSLSANITLTDWDNDEIYDMINVEQYSHFVVDAVEAETFTMDVINATDSWTLSLDAEEEEYAISIKDVDGNDVAFEDIKVGDVVAVLSDNLADPNNRVYIDIVVLGANTVEGTVVAYDDSNGRKATIGDATYVVSNEYPAGTKDKVKISSEGVYYLDINGKIFDFDGSKAASGNLGIILKAGTSTSGVDADVAQIKMLNKDGQIVVYNLAETVKIRKQDDSLVSYKRADTVTATDFANTKFYAAGAATTNIGAYLADDALFGLELTNGTPVANKTEAFSDKRIVQYKANANGEITEITPNGVKDRFTVGTFADDTVYNASTRRFAGEGKVDANAILFSLNANNIANSKVLSVDSLVDDAEYDLYMIEEEGDNIAAVLLSGGNTISSAVEGFAVVTAKATTNDADEDIAYSLTVVENNSNEVKTILVTKDTQLADDYTYTGVTDARDFAGNDATVGAVMLYSADEAGNATVIAPIAKVESNKYTVIATPAGNCDNTYVSGVTAAKFDGSEIITNVGSIEVEATTNKYRLNNANPSRPTVVAGSYKGGNVVNPAIENGTFKGNAVLARLVDGDVTDVITIDARVAVPGYALTTNYSLAGGLGSAIDPSITWNLSAKSPVLTFAGKIAEGNYTITYDNGENDKWIAEETVVNAGKPTKVKQVFAHTFSWQKAPDADERMFVEYPSTWAANNDVTAATTAGDVDGKTFKVTVAYEDGTVVATGTFTAN